MLEPPTFMEEEKHCHWASTLFVLIPQISELRNREHEPCLERGVQGQEWRGLDGQSTCCVSMRACVHISSAHVKVDWGCGCL